MRKYYTQISVTALVITIIIALIGLVAWITHIEFLKLLLPGHIKIKFNAALALLLASGALLIRQCKASSPAFRQLGHLLCLLVLLIGVLTLVEYLFNFNSGIDELFIREDRPLEPGNLPGRMSVVAAVNFILISLVLLRMNKPNSAVFQFFCLAVVGLIAVVMLVGVNFIQDVSAAIRMAVHLALGFITLATAIWFSQPELHEKISFEWKLYTGFLAVILLVLTLGLFSNYYGRKRIDNSRWIKHVGIVQKEANQLLSDIQALSPQLKQNSITQQQSLKARVQQLYLLTADNPQQQKRLDSLAVIVTGDVAKLNKHETIVQLVGLTHRLLDAEIALLIIRQEENEEGIVSSNRIFLMFLTGSLLLLTGILFSVRNNYIIRKKSDRQFEALLEAAPDAIVIVNEQGIIQLVNLQTQKLFGFSKTELINQPVEILIPGNLRSRHASHRKSFFDAARVREMGAGLELFALKKDGISFPVEISLSPITTEQGIWVLASIRDITERKKAQEKISYLARLVEDTSEAVFSSDANGNIKSWNKAAENLFGFTSEEVINRPAREFMRLQLSDEERAVIREKLAKEGYWKGELNYLKKDGTPLYISISNAATRNLSGAIDGYVSVCRDFSQRKLLEDELRTTNEELEAFSYSISHDLRAPLRAVIGFTSILEMEYTSQLNDEAKRLMSVIKTNTQRMGQLIDDLLTFSRLSRQELVKKKVDTQNMVADIIRHLETADKRQINWQIATLPAVMADHNTIRQVWINLLSNAVKYSGKQAQPIITVGTTNTDAEIIFEVTDNGVGFDEAHAGKLFKVFQRLHTMEEFDGTGVGLAIVERIVVKHGGRVWAHAEKGKGASFYFSLPLQLNTQI